MRTAELAARRRTVRGHFHLTMSNSPSRSRGAFLRPGFATLLHSPRIEGWAERRETFGCFGTRGACHNAAHQAPSEAPASHDAGRSPLGAPPWLSRIGNNLVISRHSGVRVPMVSQRAFAATYSGGEVLAPMAKEPQGWRWPNWRRRCGRGPNSLDRLTARAEMERPMLRRQIGAGA
jgi:hypothetical protein